MGMGSSSQRAQPRTAGVSVPPPVLYVIGVASGVALDRLLSPPALPAILRWSAGTIVTVGGLLLAASFLRAFRAAGTPVDLRKPTSALVTTGPYRFSRNPGYLSLTLISIGTALLLDAPWAIAGAAVATVVVDRWVIRREERYLREVFGSRYETYARKTRRWL